MSQHGTDLEATRRPAARGASSASDASSAGSERSDAAHVVEPRIAHVDGTIVLYDAAAEQVADAGVEHWFDRDYWREVGAPLSETTGRGAVVVLDHGSEKWVLRHYNRGGLVAHFVEDHYVWTGLERTRAFREWRLLARLLALGLPVPRPIAARVVRRGLRYRADIATRYLPDTRPLSAVLDAGMGSGTGIGTGAGIGAGTGTGTETGMGTGAVEEAWPRIGAMVRAFHDCGVDHPDLTAHNILLAPEGAVFLVDFDNARLRPPGRWQEAGLARLQRSLRKVALETGAGFHADGWRRLEEAYRSGGAVIRRDSEAVRDGP